MFRTLRAGIAVALMTFCTAGGAAAAAQEPPAFTMYELVLRDGSRMYGSIEKESADEVVLKTPSGVVVTAGRAQIVALKAVNGRIVAGEFQRTDPTSTRLFFAPTGRQLKKGEAYFGVYELLMPTVQVGVTNRFSIGGGTPLIFFGDGDDGWERPFWLTPKLQLVDTGRVQVAAGVFHGMNLDGDGGGIAYGVATTGSQSASITGGAGVAYSGDGGRGFVLMLGGDRQVARNVKVITENYIWKRGDGIVSFGFRFFGEQLSADLGLATPIGADDLFVFPVVNFVYSF